MVHKKSSLIKRMQEAEGQFALGHKLELQQLTVEDWPLWRKLRLQALSGAPYAFGSKLADWQGAGDSEQRWRYRVSSVSLNLVAFLDHRPVGMVSATEPDQNRTVELISMWVAPSGRGYGVGDALVAAVIEWAQDQQALCVCLAVTESNEHAISLYIRHGFVNAGELLPADSNDVPERRFLRNLVP